MRALQADREQAIGPLVEVLAKRSALLKELAALDASYGKAYVEAENAGWNVTELKALGADEPVKRPKGRPRKRSVTRKSAVDPAGPTPQLSTPPAAVPAQESPGRGVPAAVDISST